MPDSRVTVPIEDFARTMRSLFPRYASSSDERLIEIFASENPQCRLHREGANVSLENLSSIFTREAERQAEEAVPHSEPTAAETSSPVMASELIEGGKPELGEKESGETASPGRAIPESREQSDANGDEPNIPSFGLEEKPTRPVALWVACIIGVLALCGTGLYYALHARVENHNNTPLREAAPVAASNAPVPEPAAPVQEPQAEVATAAPPAVMKADPNSSLPAFGVDQLVQRFQAAQGGQDLIDKRIRITGKIETLGQNGVSFIGHESNLTYWFDVHGFGDKELDSLKEGDTAEVVCEFTGNRASTGGTVMRWSFRGFKIRKVSP